MTDGLVGLSVRVVCGQCDARGPESSLLYVRTLSRTKNTVRRI
jgi:hypothetical protein